MKMIIFIKRDLFIIYYIKISLFIKIRYFEIFFRIINWYISKINENIVDKYIKERFIIKII